MADALLGYLQQIRDTVVQGALRLVSGRLAALEAKVNTLDATALKTGSPVDGYNERIRNVAEPQAERDAVTLSFLRRHVATAIQISQGVPRRPPGDAGALPGLPAPTGTFTGTPLSHGGAGGVTTFTWTSLNATSAEATFEGVTIPLPLAGSAPYNFTTSTTVTLVLRGPGGVTTYELTITVTATPAPTPSPTGTFVANQTTVAPGTPVILAWTSSNATGATIDQGVGAVTPVAGGNVTVAPLVTTLYQITFTGAGGSRAYAVTVTVNTGPPPPPPPPPPPSSYDAQLLTWGFANGAARFSWKGFTSFALYHDALDPARSAGAFQVVDYWAGKGATVPRVLMAITGFPFGPDIDLNPLTRANYYTFLGPFVQYLNSKGMMPELVLFGGFVQIWGSDIAAMSAHVKKVATALLPYRGAYIQVANEWNQIGFTSPTQLVELANAYKSIDPTRPITLSAPNGPGDGDTGTITAPANYLTVHIDRLQSPTRAQWVIRHFGNPTIMNAQRPAVSDEPTNAGPASAGVSESDPQYWFAFGGMSQLMGFSGTLHYELGLRSETPFPGSPEDLCINDWLQAYLEFPTPDQGGALFAATGAGVAFGPCPWPSSGANQGLIGRTTSTGSATALVFGPAPLPAVLPGWQTPTQITRLNPLGAPYGDFIRAYRVLPSGF